MLNNVGFPTLLESWFTTRRVKASRIVSNGRKISPRLFIPFQHLSLVKTKNKAKSFPDKKQNSPRKKTLVNRKGSIIKKFIPFLLPANIILSNLAKVIDLLLCGAALACRPLFYKTFLCLFLLLLSCLDCSQLLFCTLCMLL